MIKETKNYMNPHLKMMNTLLNKVVFGTKVFNMKNIAIRIQFDRGRGLMSVQDLLR